MNSAMIRVGTCNRKCSSETAPCANITTVKTVVICCHGVGYVIVIIPGNSSSRRDRNCSWCKSHIYYANRIRRLSIIVVSTIALRTRNQYGREQQNQRNYTRNPIFYYCHGFVIVENLYDVFHFFDL
jgi:hypothetical protein